VNALIQPGSIISFYLIQAHAERAYRKINTQSDCRSLYLFWIQSS